MKKYFSHPIGICLLAIVSGLVVFLVFVHLKKSFSPVTNSIIGLNDGSIQYTMIPTQNKLYEYPTVTHYPDQHALQRVNDDLDNIFYEFGCWEISGTNEGVMTLRVDYAQKDTISITQDGWYVCDGVQDLNALETFTFDMKLGKRITFPDLFSDFDLHQEEIIATAYADTLYDAELYNEQYHEEEDLGICTDGVNTFEVLMNAPWHNFLIIPEERALVITPAYEDQLEACAPRVQIAIDTLIRFASEDSLLRRF